MEKLIQRIPAKAGDISSYIKIFDDYYREHDYCDISSRVARNERIEKLIDGTMEGDELIITAIEFIENGTSLARVMNYVASNHHEIYNYNTFKRLAEEYRKLFAFEFLNDSGNRRNWKWDNWYHISLEYEREAKELFKRLGIEWKP